MRWAVTANCLDCHHVATWVDVLNKHRKATVAQRQVWADTHYGLTGHHRFRFATTEITDVSVAHLPLDPNQGLLTDDENYSTFHLGGES